MAFDFPSSPAVGDSYAQGGARYFWDGEKWNGGAFAAEPDEQFFDLSGLTQKDIIVPAWAKGCTLTGVIHAPAGSMGLVLRHSLDGTTFLAGASDYNTGGPYHASGTNGYSQGVPAASTYITLVNNGDSTTFPMSFTADIELVRATTTPQLGFLRSYGKSNLSTDSAYYYRTAWPMGHIATAAAGSALAVKAMRVLFSVAAAFQAGSWLRVKWLGDTGTLQTLNSIPDAPNDGGEYVRVNNVWRLKTQTFNAPYTGGGSSLIIPPPNGAKTAIIKAQLYAPSANQLIIRFSPDGVTFPQAATDYTYAGYAHFAGSAAPGIGIYPITTGAYMLGSLMSDNASIPTQLEMMVTVGSTFKGWKLTSTSYYSPAANQMQHLFVAGYSNNASIANATRLWTQLIPSSVAFTAGSNVNVEWIY